MRYFAEIDKNSLVIQVLLLDDNSITDGNDFFNKTLNLGGNWLETFLDSNERKNLAGVGFYYDNARNAFIAPQPFNSWVLDEITCQWDSPIPYPSDGKMYRWNEESLSWVELG